MVNLLESLKNLQIWTRLFSFWYFACAFLLTNWTTFARPDFTFKMFLESDLLGLKHMMHASFVLGGVRALGSTGNRRYLEIVAAVTLLSSFPSCVSAVLTFYHFLNSVTVGSIVQMIVSFGMLLVTSFSAYFALLSIHYSEKRSTTSTADKREPEEDEELLTWLGTKTRLVAVSSLQERMRSASLMFEKTVGKVRMIDWKEKSTTGYAVLYFEMIFHFTTNVVFLAQRMQSYGNADSLRTDETVGSLVESTSLALHWGFLLGNAFHGLRSYSPQCLDIFCWGKLLLIGATVSSLWSMSNGLSNGRGAGMSGQGGGGGLSTTWVLLEVVVHIMTVVGIRRVRFSIGKSTPTHETIYSCHKGTLSSKEEHAMSLWAASTHHITTTGNGNTFRWYWFGRSSAICSFGCFLTMAMQCIMLVLLSFDVPGGGNLAIKKEILRTYGVGMNFAIHAAAMCMLALYRPTRDRFGYEHSRAFNISVCTLFCMLFAWQIMCAWSSNRLILNYVFMFNSFRIFVYAACGTSFWLTPKRMPDLLLFTSRPPEEGPSEPKIDYEVTAIDTCTHSNSKFDREFPMNTGSSTSTDTGTTTMAAFAAKDAPQISTGVDKLSIQKWLIDCCVSFGFVQWSGPNGVGTNYDNSNVKTLPLPVRSILVKADQWTRISFWLYVVAAATLSASDGYWLGSHGTRTFVNIGCLTMPSQICFHYCFILTGYSLKGLRSPHVPMLKLICSCTLFIVLITMTSTFTLLYASQYWLSLQFFGTSVCLGLQCWYCWIASVTMSKIPRMFPKSGVSHNWM
jgi:hypothetical protein